MVVLPSLYTNNFQKVNLKQAVGLGIDAGQSVPKCGLRKEVASAFADFPSQTDESFNSAQHIIAI